MTPDQIDYIKELETRRIVASRHKISAAAVTTSDDIDSLNEIVQSLPAEVRKLIYLYEDVWQEFTTGQRCAVCGMTATESKAIDYNCAYEC